MEIKFLKGIENSAVTFPLGRRNTTVPCVTTRDVKCQWTLACRNSICAEIPDERSELHCENILQCSTSRKNVLNYLLLLKVFHEIRLNFLTYTCGKNSSMPIW